MHCVTPDEVLFNDLDEEVAQPWVKQLQTQLVADWDDTVTVVAGKTY